MAGLHVYRVRGGVPGLWGGGARGEEVCLVGAVALYSVGAAVTATEHTVPVRVLGGTADHLDPSGGRKEVSFKLPGINKMHYNRSWHVEIQQY